MKTVVSLSLRVLEIFYVEGSSIFISTVTVTLKEKLVIPWSE